MPTKRLTRRSWTKLAKSLAFARWLTRDVENPDAGYSISLWEDEAAMRAYESSNLLKNTILPKLTPFFSGDYTTTHCDMRFREKFK